MKPFLSICIPTFERGEIVYNTVKKCLEYKNPNIEVIVSDNCSEDNTAELLATITDNRFKYFKNDYNNGFLNLISVLTYGEGEYLLLTSDEAPIVLENIDKIINILKNENPAVLKASANFLGKKYVAHKNGIYQAGFEAIRTYGSGCSYVSGYIYNKKIMDKVLMGAKGTNIDRRFGYTYCFTNLAREMLQYGSLCFREEVITDEISVGKMDIIAFSDGDGFCFSVEKRFVATKEKINSIARTNLSEKEKYIMSEHYILRDVVATHISEYRLTFNDEVLNQIKNQEGAEIFYEYYMENRRKLESQNIFDEIEIFIKKYIEYIDDIKMFGDSYENISKKYSYIHDEYKNKISLLLEEFKDEIQNR